MLLSRRTASRAPSSASNFTRTLARSAGKTTLTTTVLYPSLQVRDAALKSGMDHGVEATYVRLAALLAESPAPQRIQAGAWT